MASRNPALSDDIFRRETSASRGVYGTPSGAPADELPPGIFGGPRSTLPPPPGIDPNRGGPITGGPAAGAPVDTGNTMRLGGTMSASGILLALVVFAGAIGWRGVETITTMTAAGPKTEASFPVWIIPVMLIALGVGVLTSFKPKLARFTAPVYAVLQGLWVGAISHVFESLYSGVVLQAVLLTAGVFAVMAVLYGTRTIRVTDRLRRGVIAATGGIMVVYLLSFLAQVIFKAQVPFLHDASPIGILISLAIVGVASFNLLLDFDFIEKGVTMGAPRYMEWYGAFGLMVSLVWLYLEILRLLSKLRER